MSGLAFRVVRLTWSVSRGSYRALRIVVGYLSGTKASALLAFMGITNCFAPAS